MKYSKLPEAYTSFLWGFKRACIRRDIYPGGLINGIEKGPWKNVVVALIKILFAYTRGVGWGLIIGCIFCLQVHGPISGVCVGGGGGGGL